MKVLVLGSGGREHSLAWKFAQSPRVERVFAGPGNAGTSDVATNIPSVDPSAFDTILEAVKDNRIDCVFVGPEVPLAEGVVDFLRDRGVAAIGPGKSEARLESSKTFSKAFMTKNGIPTAAAVEFHDASKFELYIRGQEGRPLVVKKNGLAAGKGVLESSDPEEMVRFGLSILPDSLLVEERLVGWEVSIFGVSDGKSHVVLPPCTDFKKAGDGDTGPNTGGMGSICPVPRVDDPLMERILKDVVDPTYRALEKEGLAYSGVLYFGLMITAGGPKVLEFNVRFGDPETQVLLPSLDLDFGELAEALAQGTLAARFTGGKALRASRAALGVVVASAGYPHGSAKGSSVQMGREASADGAIVFHASTSRDAAGKLVTGGGRCFTVVGTGADLAEASRKAYAAARGVRFEGGWYRKDIGRAFIGDGV